MIIQNKRNLAIHNSIDEAKKYLQSHVLNNATKLKEGEVLHTRYKSVGEVYDLTATLYTNDKNTLYCVFNEATPKVPSLSTTSGNDIVEVYVGFTSNNTIKRLLLGSGMKDPYNFVMKYNGGSYDPHFTIYGNYNGSCQVGDEHKVCIIESMNHSKWLHSCNFDLTNFDGDPNSEIQIQNVYIPTSLYFYLSNTVVEPTMVYSFLKQFTNGFSYQTDGRITVSSIEIEDTSFLVENSTAIAYTIKNSIKQFFDSTMFFNQAMQGKYIPFMWDGKLKYFHFNHKLK